MTDQIHLSVVIPAFNEEKKIAADLSVATDYLDRQSYAYEIIVVDDGSRDRTADIARDVAGRNTRIRVIQQPENLGKGAAVRSGMQAARGAVALFADAGTCVPYTCIEQGLRILANGADMAFGSRSIAKSRIVKPSPFYRRLGSKGFQLIVEHVLELKDVADTQCGFKLFSRKAYRDIFHHLITDGFMFDIETIMYARWRKYHIQFFPVDWSNDPDSRFNPLGGSIRNFKEIVNILLRIRSLRQGRIEIQIRE